MSQNIPELERITFFNGQRLTAVDLNALQKANRELRWLHNRSLHRWGIGLGFDVTGAKGDSVVQISPGYGIDALGREIILTETLTKTVPAVGGADDGTEAVFYLVASYQADAGQKVLERRRGVCLPEGTVRLGEEPFIEWRKPGQFREGYELILAHAFVLNCQLSRPLSLSARRYASPQQQPYIAAGQTVAKDTDWKAWLVMGTMVGIYTRVDTSAAHFKTTPRYSAHVMGERFLGDPPGPLLIVGMASVTEATPDAFTLQVLLPHFAPSVPVINPDLIDVVTGGPAMPGIVKRLGWQVVWMGTEG